MKGAHPEKERRIVALRHEPSRMGRRGTEWG
eukprot:CAMPEP_0117545010 /NCGR_PEP_ID=MMETSP0784-20121206/45873_1 /TAXON_ID=39447 /ORGANISM="" /LENGTH=30 /DNA_ID= /DNA_START= /DNA_END= /DNA_ORIENTATION=